MEELINLIKEASGMEAMRESCRIKINRAEVSPITSFIKGKEEGKREFAIELLKVLEEA